MGNLYSASFGSPDDDDTGLLLATIDGHLASVQRLLTEGRVNIDTKTPREERTPLHMACFYNRLEIAKLLIENGADLNAVDSKGNTAFFWACFIGPHLEIAQLLIDKGADINAKDKNGMTALHFACKKNRNGLVLVQFLIENGADVDPKENDGMTPLNLTCGNELDVRLIELLIENGADVNTKGRALRVMHQVPPTRKVVEVDTRMTPLHRACQIGHLEAVQLLLNRGAKVDVKTGHGYTPFQIASERNHVEVVWFMVCQYPWLILSEEPRLE